MTLVDDQGIDCVLRLDHKRYIYVQIKARSRNAQQWNFFAAMTFVPRDNFFFIFYTEKNDTFWTIPSIELKSLCTINISGKHKGKMSLLLPKTERGDKAFRFEKYKNENGFELLKSYQTTVY
jgi:hypothetical protein